VVASGQKKISVSHTDYASVCENKQEQKIYRNLLSQNKKVTLGMAVSMCWSNLNVVKILI